MPSAVICNIQAFTHADDSGNDGHRTVIGRQILNERAVYLDFVEGEAGQIGQ